MNQRIDFDGHDLFAARRHRDALRSLEWLEAAGFQARIAGGAVRDMLGGGTPVDFDIATTAKPDETAAVFNARNVRTVPTGLAHGTITVLMAAGPIEVTTLRRDVATDGRHAEVAFGTSFEDDAARRDFTVNAMFQDHNGLVYDFHGGLEDLNNKRLVFVGAAAERVKEDYLRIMRCFRFWAQLGFMPAPETLAAVSAGVNGLAKISQERITSELIKTLAGTHLAAALSSLCASGVFAQVLPELAAYRESTAFSKSVAAVGSLASAPRGFAVLALLALQTGIREDLGPRLKLSRVEARRHQAAVAEFYELKRAADTPEPAAAMALIDRAESAGGEGSFRSFFAQTWSAALLLDACRGDAKASARGLNHLLHIEEKFGARRQGKLPIAGDALAARLGIVPGRELGEFLERLTRSFRNSLWTTPEEGYAWFDKHGRKSPDGRNS